MRYIDFHCDTLSLYRTTPPAGESLRQNSGCVDFRRMREAGCSAQFFAVFFPPADKLDTDDFSYFCRLYMPFLRELEICRDSVALTKTYGDYVKHRQEGRTSAFLTLEDGRLLRNSHYNLDFLFECGVRLITLTWNGPNCLGWPNSDDPTVMKQCLTPFGREAVEHMNRLGILVDVSHLSDGGFWDVAEISSKPFIASHSNARALSPHRRNLTDPMIRRLAEKGGVIGVNFAPFFLSPDLNNTKSTVSLLCRHIQHLYRIGGLECIVLGSDWDGFEGDLEIPDPCALPLLFEELHRQGFPASALEKMAWGNAERVLMDCLPS